MLYLQVGMTCSEVAGLCVADISLPPQISAHHDEVGYVQVKRWRGVEHLPLNWKICDALKTWLEERDVIDMEQGLLTDALFVSRQ